MVKIAVTYSTQVGGMSVVSLQNCLKKVGADVVDADYRVMMEDISEETFNQLYETQKGRRQLFAHAKFKAEALLKDMDGVALSGNNAMIDPWLFNQDRDKDENYDLSRTLIELALVHVAINKGIPVLGVCGGHQVLAVYGGGEVANLSAEKLEIQRYADYEELKIYKNTMLSKIIEGKSTIRNQHSSDNQISFFGAHAQVVSKQGEGYITSALSKDGESIEASENEHGVPVISTQFHPEVGALGMPNVEFIYQKDDEEVLPDVRIFEYFKRTAETHYFKKQMNQEFKRLQTEGDSVIKPSEIKSSYKPYTKQQKTSWFGDTDKYKLAVWALASIIISAAFTAAFFIAFPPSIAIAAIGMMAYTGIIAGAVAGAVLLGSGISYGAGLLFNTVKSGIGYLMRKTLSDHLTKINVDKLKSDEQALSKGEAFQPSQPESEDVENSHQDMLKKFVTKTPQEILTQTEAKLFEQSEPVFSEVKTHDFDDQHVIDESDDEPETSVVSSMRA